MIKWTIRNIMPAASLAWCRDRK